MKKIFYALALVVILLSGPAWSSAAGSTAINISPQTGSYKIGQTFKLTISVDPKLEKIDMVRTKLNFTPRVLEIKDFSIGPVFSFQAGSNGFDNSAGTFSWGAGAPGGISAPNTFGNVTFIVKEPGNATVSVSEGSMALSAGEDKFNSQLSSAAFTLLPAVSQNPPVQNKQSVTRSVPKENTEAQTTEAVSENSENNVEKQIIPGQPDNSFIAGLLNALSFSQMLKNSAIVLAILIIILLAIILRKIIGDFGLVFKKTNNKK